jgi:hypothetical protein
MQFPFSDPGTLQTNLMSEAREIHLLGANVLPPPRAGSEMWHSPYDAAWAGGIGELLGVRFGLGENGAMRLGKEHDVLEQTKNNLLLPAESRFLLARLA